MEVFQEWQRYLASKSVGECMRQDAQLTIVSPDITVLQLVQVFVENDLRAAPVDFGNGKYEFVDYIDLLKHLCALLDAKQDDAAAVLPEFLTTVIRDVANLSGRNPFVPISTSQTMLDVCKTFAEAKRVPIVDSDGSLKDIVTAQDLIRCALEGVPTSLEEFGSLKVGQFFIERNVITSLESNTALSAFRLLNEHGFSALPVLDEDGEMSSVLSIRDLKYIIAQEDPNLLTGSVFDLIIYGKEGQLRGETGKTQFPYIACNLSTTLASAIRKLQATRVHRLVVTDGAKHSVGVLSLTDILFLINNA